MRKQLHSVLGLTAQVEIVQPGSDPAQRGEGAARSRSPWDVTAALDRAFNDRMNEQHEADEIDGWPLPSQDVLRELDPPAVVWSESDPAATPQTRRSARG